MKSSSESSLSIAIDGPAGAGKSTTARMLAQELQIVYVDSGAMYRAVAWTCLHESISVDDLDAVSKAASRLDIRFAPAEGGDGVQHIVVDGHDITSEIRTPEISQLASSVSVIPAVRESLVAKQRLLGQEGGVVMEGRDIGTVVLPQADVKVFLTASLDERARRRFAEMATPAIDFATVRTDMAERDRRDSTRAVSPLTPATDAIIIDSNNMNARQVVDEILALCKQKRMQAPQVKPESEPATASPKAPLSDRRPDEYTPTYVFVRNAFRCFFAAMGGVHVYGHENIPATGPAIIAANHTSMADPPLEACAIKRPLRFFAKKELFDVPIIGGLIRKLGAFPVVRGSADRTAIRTAINVLENGELLIIFPEGMRGDGVTFGAPEKGMAMIALKAHVPIVPAFIEGTTNMLPKGVTLPRRAKLYVRFGPPIDTTAFTGKQGLDTLGPAVMDSIAKLRVEHRRG